MALFSQDPLDSYFFDGGSDSDSSQCEASSSDNEIDILLHGTLEQRKKLKALHSKKSRQSAKQNQGEQSTSSEDEFEKEMNAELNDHIKKVESLRADPQPHESALQRPSQMSKLTTKNKNKESYYDDVYFDSDEEEEKEGEKSHHAIISNDDLFYDPTMDDKDQSWVDMQRQKHCSQSQPQTTSAKKMAPKATSDALLDCPACLTTVCIDCQRHESYKNQFRAMFVMNCVTDTSEQLQCQEQLSKSKRKKKTAQFGESSVSNEVTDSDLFNPVRCTECNTVVGVVDNDEVYHFFNVIASYT